MCQEAFRLLIFLFNQDMQILVFIRGMDLTLIRFSFEQT